MPIYDKPVRVLIREMAADLAPHPDSVFSKSEALAWFASRYSKINEGTIGAHLVRFSINAPTRLHYGAKPDEDLFFRIDSSHFRLYNAAHDPAPIHSTGEMATMGVVRDANQPDSIAEWLGRFASRDIIEGVGRVLAHAITVAHEYGSGCWSVSGSRRGIRLSVGRLATLTFSRKGVEFGVIEGQRTALAGELPPGSFKFTGAFTAEPRAASCLVTSSAVVTHESNIREALDAFIPIAAATAGQSPYARSHSSEVVTFLSAVLGTELPSPDYVAASARKRGPSMPPPPAVAVTHPRTLFKKVDYELSNLISYIELGDIALPDLQRPFVWSTTKVRDLFDSMFRGYPVGYLLFWSNAAMRRVRTVGRTEPQHLPSLLIVDGQQRLTSLFAVFRGVPVMDEDFVERHLEIAFRPRDGRFEVTDAAIRRDPEFIPSISDLWKSRNSSRAITNRFIEQLEVVRALSEDDQEAMSHNLDRLIDLQKYPFTALEISSEVDEQSVADVFVRINSEGVKLNQSDFILTLLSVVWPEGRKQLEQFAHDSAKAETAARSPSPFNHLIQIAPDQLLRVAIAVGFHRARLKAVYQLLRAKDLDGTPMAAERRESEIGKLREAQASVLNLRHWHSFLNAIAAAGYRSADMISSDTALIYSYAFYLIGRLKCNVPEYPLQRLIAKWFVANLVTGRYSGSSETIMEEDLAIVRDVDTAEAFAQIFETRLGSILTNDFWEKTLPLELETSSPRSPAALAYLAAQVRLNAPVLFSDKPIGQLVDPSIRPQRTSVDRHHLFPRQYLEKRGIADRKLINQAANFAVVEWPDNLSIGSKSPKEYVPAIKSRFSAPIWDAMCRAHALPPEWHELEYSEFLHRRRTLMAAMIRRSYELLAGAEDVVEETHASEMELQVWGLVREVETRLRETVQRKYHERWGGAADARIERHLGADAVETIARTRAKRRQQFPDAPNSDGLLDYTYLGQLLQLMLSGESWELFKDAFRDKRELEDLARSVTVVRNEAAHFRHVPEPDLLRCRVAANDLLNKLNRLD
jgi:hypothetical protein